MTAYTYTPRRQILAMQNFRNSKQSHPVVDPAVENDMYYTPSISFLAFLIVNMTLVRMLMYDHGWPIHSSLHPSFPEVKDTEAEEGNGAADGDWRPSLARSFRGD